MRVPAIGEVVAGRYRVSAKLGEGGMGTVFRAENIVTGKQVAIKWMHSNLGDHSQAATRLVREAQAASRLSHPNVVDVYDVVQDGDTLFLVMELLEGQTLREYLEVKPYPKLSEFLALMLPAMDGVAAAHDKGVIHRDLKPDNIFLVRRPGSAIVSAKVLDFGVAKLSEARGLTLTATGTAIGTPLYMSLEQLRGDRDIDARADVYSFGVMLYEAIAGDVPFRGATLSELAIKVATTEAAPVKKLRPDIPTTLARIVDWSITKNRDQRISSLRALMIELEPFARDYSFRDQMTNQTAALPLLASDPERLGVRNISRHAPSPAAKTRSDSPAGQRQTPDTLTARELLRAPRFVSRAPVRLAVAALLVVGAGALFLQRGPAWAPLFGVDKPADSSAPLTTAPTAPPSQRIPPSPAVQTDIRASTGSDKSQVAARQEHDAGRPAEPVAAETSASATAQPVTQPQPLAPPGTVQPSAAPVVPPTVRAARPRAQAQAPRKSAPKSAADILGF